MKKTYLLLIFIVISFSLFSNNPKKKIVATASIFADMANELSGGHLEIFSIVPIGSDPHLYEPRPSDVRLVVEADLVLRNELTFEGWLSKLIDNSGTKAKIVTITEGVEAITSLTYKNSADPHAWMDANNGIIYIENIKNALVEIDPDNAEVYEFNYGVYRRQLEELDNYIKTEIQKIPENRRTLITSHDAFQYYGRRYGIKLESILGISTEAEAQTSDIQRLNKVIRENQIPAVFIESTINPKMLQQIAKDNDIEIGGELFADSIGEENSDAPTYYDMLKYNTDVIVKALTRIIEPKTDVEKDSEDENSWMIWGVIGVLFLGAFLFVFQKMNN